MPLLKSQGLTFVEIQRQKHEGTEECQGRRRQEAILLRVRVEGETISIWSGLQR